MFVARPNRKTGSIFAGGALAENYPPGLELPCFDEAERHGLALERSPGVIEGDGGVAAGQEHRVAQPDGCGLTRIEPEGRVVRMWAAIETYMERKQPLIIIAGADYGQGSSRDWAAKGVRLAGVEAIAAEGFERIHRTNLIGMGVLPLEFQPGTTRKTLGLDGTEVYDVVGERTPRATLTLVVHRKNGETVEVPVTCRLDTGEEVSIYEAGGVLQRFAQDFLASSKAA